MQRLCTQQGGNIAGWKLGRCLRGYDWLTTYMPSSISSNRRLWKVSIRSPRSTLSYIIETRSQARTSHLLTEANVHSPSTSYIGMYLKSMSNEMTRFKTGHAQTFQEADWVGYTATMGVNAPLTVNAPRGNVYQIRATLGVSAPCQAFIATNASASQPKPPHFYLRIICVNAPVPCSQVFWVRGVELFPNQAQAWFSLKTSVLWFELLLFCATTTKRAYSAPVPARLPLHCFPERPTSLKWKRVLLITLRFVVVEQECRPFTPTERSS